MSDRITVSVLQERDAVAPWTIYAGALVLGVLLALGAVATWVLARGMGPPPGGPPEVPVPREVNMVDQSLFVARESSTGRPERAPAPLDRYEWVDRERGVVQIPIDRAMALIRGGGHVH